MNVTVEPRIPGWHAADHHEAGVRYLIANETMTETDELEVETTRCIGRVSVGGHAGVALARDIFAPSLRQSIDLAIALDTNRS